MNLHKDKYIIVEVIPTHSDNTKGFIPSSFKALI